jgi:WD40 repeat protein
VAFSPDGTRLLSSGLDSGCKLWDAATGQLIRSFEVEEEHSISSVAVSPDGTRVLASDSYNKTLKLWDTATGELTRTFEGHSFSPDGTRLLSVPHPTQS